MRPSTPKNPRKVGLFIPLPRHLADQFPSLAPHDNSPSHVTLLYVGDVPDERRDEFLMLIERVLVTDRIKGSVRATLDRLEYFDTPHDGRVAVMRVLFNEDMSRLRQRIVRALRDAAFDVKDSFPDVYRPHVALRYMPEGERAYRGAVPSGSWEFEGVEVWGLDPDYLWSREGHDADVSVPFRKYAKAPTLRPGDNFLWFVDGEFSKAQLGGTPPGAVSLYVSNRNRRVEIENLSRHAPEAVEALRAWRQEYGDDWTVVFDGHQAGTLLEFLKVPASTHVSVWYHGTSSASAEAILKQGLRPRGSSDAVFVGGSTPSNPKYVYLASDDGNDVRFAARAAARHDHSQPVVLAIRASALDSDRLRADEDSGAVTWTESLEKTGNVAYEGVIPPGAIQIHMRLEDDGWKKVALTRRAAQEKITRTYTVHGRGEALAQLERILVAMHMLGSWGSSRSLQIGFDGDGPDKLDIEELKDRTIQGFDDLIDSDIVKLNGVEVVKKPSSRTAGLSTRVAQRWRARSKR